MLQHILYDIFLATGRHSKILKDVRHKIALKQSMEIFGWSCIEAIQIKCELYVIRSCICVWAGWSNMKIPRDCALFPYLPSTHDTLDFFSKFYKILNKINTDCSLQCISSWKLLFLCHFVIKICVIILMSILAKDLVSTGARHGKGMLWFWYMCTESHVSDSHQIIFSLFS